MQSEVTDAMCEALDKPSTPIFGSVEQDLSAFPLPYDTSVQLAIQEIPAVALAAILTVLLLIAVRPRPKTLARTVSTLWVAAAISIVSVVSYPWWSHKSVEAFIHFERANAIEPFLAGPAKLAHVAHRNFDNYLFAGFNEAVLEIYDHYSAREIVRLEASEDPDKAHELADRVLSMPHVSARLDPKYALEIGPQRQINLVKGLLGNISQSYADAKEFDDALRVAEFGYSLDQDREYLHGVVLPRRAALGRAMIQDGQLKAASDLILSLPRTWHHPNLPVLIEEAQQGLTSYSLAFINEQNLSTDQLVTVSRKLQERYVNQVREKSPRITCNLAFFQGLKGLASLNNGRPEEAIDHFLKSEKYVSDYSYAQTLMPVAYAAHGAELFDLEAFEPAARAFQNAHRLDPTLDTACSGAAAMRLAASQSLDVGDLEQATSRSEEAVQLCPDPIVDRDLLSKINLERGLEHLQFGRWRRAKITLQQVTQSGSSSVSKIARYYLKDVDAAQARHRKLSQSRHMFRLPDFTGQYCAQFTESGGKLRCDAISVFNGDDEVGRSLSQRLSDVTFLRPNGYLSVYDGLGDGRYNTWEVQTSGSIEKWIDTDADNRPDFRESYAEAQLLSRKQLSGRISMRFAGAIVNKRSLDLFSRPDIFLAAWKNGRYFGRTETIENNTRPRWRDYFVFDYKFGDKLEIVGFDDDWFGDEFVDVLTYEELPTSGYTATKDGHLTIAVHIQPTERREGRFRGADGRSVFEDPAFLNDDSAVARQIRASYQEDSRAQIASLAASVVIPHIGVYTLMNRARLLEQMVAHWLGYEVSSKVINQSDADVH